MAGDCCSAFGRHNPQCSRSLSRQNGPRRGRSPRQVRYVSFYEGPAVVVVGEGPALVVNVLAQLDAAQEDGSPLTLWGGRLIPQSPRELWPVHRAGLASLNVDGDVGEFRITVYSETGPSVIEGFGPPPFS